MNKRDFLMQLRKGLSGLTREDMEERLLFYSEMIDDRMEEGLSEEEAVSAVGSVEKIVAQAVTDIPIVKVTKERTKEKRRLKVWEILLLVLGSPLWLSLGVAALAVVFSLYVSLWAVIISLWAVFGSLIGCSIGGVVAGLVFICIGGIPAGIATMGAGIVCAGLSIFAFWGCKAATKGVLVLAKKTAMGIKNCFTKKEEA